MPTSRRHVGHIRWVKVLHHLGPCQRILAVEVVTEDRPKTAFTTPEGLFQFKVMSFGLCNAPATFQRLMDRVLGGLKWSSCLVYFDDIIVIGSTFSEHLKHLTAVLTNLRQSGLKLNPAKCKLYQQQSYVSRPHPHGWPLPWRV